MHKATFIAVFMLGVFFAARAQIMTAETAIVAFVNGEPVDEGEFMMQALKERAQVIRYFRINHNSEYTGDFWTRTFDGITPADVLKDKTLDTLVQIKVQQIEAMKYGIVSDISYSGFLKALEKENIRRFEARQAGKVIYGPVQYSEEVYYNYLFSNMVIRLKDILGEKVFNLNDEKLKAAYEKDKDRLYLRGFYTDIQLFELKYKPGNSEKANGIMTGLRERRCENAYPGDPAMEIIIDDPELSFTISEIVFNDSVYSPEEDNAVRTMAKKTAEKLVTGQSSPVIEFAGALYVVRVMEKNSLGYRNFDNCKGTIRSSLIDQLYKQYVRELKLNATVELNMDTYRKISF